MASARHVCAAVLMHVARSGRLDADLDERSLSQLCVSSVAKFLIFEKSSKMTSFILRIPDREDILLIFLGSNKWSLVQKLSNVSLKCGLKIGG